VAGMKKPNDHTEQTKSNAKKNQRVLAKQLGQAPKDSLL